jgi:RNA polymerase sigma factor (TIGR02999 family)
MAGTSDNEVTRILGRAASGESSAIQELLPLVYTELRALAGSYAQGRDAQATLQPTAIVHEAYVKLVGADEVQWESRAHFFAVAAKAMRQILADYARRKAAAKRGGKHNRITLAGLQTPTPESDVDLSLLDESLTRLAEIDDRQYRIVELRFLAGLKVEEVAQVLELSVSTVEREWRMARAWLRREFSGAGER